MTTSNHASAGTQVYGNHANQRAQTSRCGSVRNGNTVTDDPEGLGGERLMEFQETCTSGACTSYTETQRWIYFAGRKMFSKTGTTLKAITPNRLASEAKHFPYGETDGTPPADTKDYFATYRRDGTGLDYAWNRYYSPTMGRFTTADPYGGSVDLSRPESWNRYTYSRSNPSNYFDPTGFEEYSTLDFLLNLYYFAPAPFSVTTNACPDCHTPGATDPTSHMHFGSGGSEELARLQPEYSSQEGPPPPLRPDDEDPPCEGLLAAMDNWVNARRGSSASGFKGLAQRIGQMRQHKRSDPSWDGHLEQIENMKSALRKFLSEWKDNDCGDPPPFVLQILDVPVLSYEDMQSLFGEQEVDEMAIVEGVGGALVVYGTYRIVRLMPSLSPPLWWTLPWNVALP